jgi:uncharacterized protein YPO0396
MKAMVNERDIQLKVPFSAFTRLMEQLQPEDMLRLRQWLDEKLAEYEDELMLANPRIMAEIREARMEYEAGEYVKLDELHGELAESEDTDV